MSQKSLYDFETEQIDKMFDCKNYLFKNSKHEKVILESDTGVKMVRHIIYKPADVSVYQRLALINNPYLCRIYEISESTGRTRRPEHYLLHMPGIVCSSQQRHRSP